MLRLVKSYCRVAVEGVGRLPKGRAVLVANHTGWLGLDYSNLALSILEATGRRPRGVVHPLWFANPLVSSTVKRLGLVAANRSTIERHLRRDEWVVVFPEAERGAFKVSHPTPYRLAPFRTGFLRAAIEAGAPIVPVAILGGEEANPVMRTLPVKDPIFGVPLPIPKNLFPYPVKWRISFLKPVRLPGTLDEDEIADVAESLRRRISRELARQARKRGNKYW